MLSQYLFAREVTAQQQGETRIPFDSPRANSILDRAQLGGSECKFVARCDSSGRKSEMSSALRGLRFALPIAEA